MLKVATSEIQQLKIWKFPEIQVLIIKTFRNSGAGHKLQRFKHTVLAVKIWSLKIGHSGHICDYFYTNIYIYIFFFCLRSLQWRPRFSTPEILLYFSLQHPLQHLNGHPSKRPNCLTLVILRKLVFPTWLGIAVATRDALDSRVQLLSPPSLGLAQAKPRLDPGFEFICSLDKQGGRPRVARIL